MHRKVESAQVFVLVCAFFAPTWWSSGISAPTLMARSNQPSAGDDGRHDFDFEIGAWTTRLSRLDRPLTGSKTWIEYTGTTIVRRLWDGRANLVELDVSGPRGRIEGLSLRLYNPDARQWSLNFSSRASGTLTPPMVGAFNGERGEFYGTDTANGRTVLARFIITPVDRDSIRFEQAFSDDGGRRWEVNWIAVDTRRKE